MASRLSCATCSRRCCRRRRLRPRLIRRARRRRPRRRRRRASFPPASLPGGRKFSSAASARGSAAPAACASLRARGVAQVPRGRDGGRGVAAPAPAIVVVVGDGPKGTPGGGKRKYTCGVCGMPKAGHVCTGRRTAASPAAAAAAMMLQRQQQQQAAAAAVAAAGVAVASGLAAAQAKAGEAAPGVAALGVAAAAGKQAPAAGSSSGSIDAGTLIGILNATPGVPDLTPLLQSYKAGQIDKPQLIAQLKAQERRHFARGAHDHGVDRRGRAWRPDAAKKSTAGNRRSARVVGVPRRRTRPRLADARRRWMARRRHQRNIILFDLKSMQNLLVSHDNVEERSDRCARSVMLPSRPSSSQ